MDDRRAEGSARAGALPGLTLSCYLRVVDWTSRLLRAGKVHMPTEALSIFERLRVDAEEWGATVSALFAGGDRTGCHFGRPDRLAEAALAHGRRWHCNPLPSAAPAEAPAA